MKAAVYAGYGPADVITIEDLEKPIPGPEEVLIKVRASSVNAPDWRIMHGQPFMLRMMFGLRKPIIRPGSDVAGEVEDVGADVTAFKKGDRVFGSCRGAFAEYACAPASKLALMPSGLSFEQAGSTSGAAITALQGLRDHGHIRPGMQVLVNGASGGVGTFAVQIAKAFGAHVTGVCSTGNVEQTRAIGADDVIDYTRQDCTGGDRRYDLILDVVGNHSVREWDRVLVADGTVIVAGAPKNGSVLQLLGLLWMARFHGRPGGRCHASFIAKINRTDLETLARLFQSGALKSVIDRRYPLSEARDAMRYVDQGHARGKVVIVADSGS